MRSYATSFTPSSASKTLLIASILLLTACTATPTIETTPPAPTIGGPGNGNNAAAPKYVPCLNLKRIIFSAPEPEKQSETAANIYDTPETTAAIREFNAKYGEACGK